MSRASRYDDAQERLALAAARAVGIQKRRRCSNRQPHASHTWRGLNTRGGDYWCVGRVRPWTMESGYQEESNP